MCKKKKKKKEEATAATATADFARGPQFAGDASKSKVLLVALTSVARILVLLGGQKSRMQQQQHQQHLSIENRSRWNASTVSEAEDEVESLMKTSDYCFLFRRKGGSLNRCLHINSWVIVFRFSTKGLPQQTFIVGSSLAKGFLELGWLWSACWHDSLDDVGLRQTRALW